jgi:hypothetical protein
LGNRALFENITCLNNIGSFEGLPNHGENYLIR